MDNRNDLIVDCRFTQATGTVERDAANEMAADLSGAHQKTIGADKNYDTKGFVTEMRRLGVTPHVAQNTARSGSSAKVCLLQAAEQVLQKKASEWVFHGTRFRMHASKTGSWRESYGSWKGFMEVVHVSRVDWWQSRQWCA